MNHPSQSRHLFHPWRRSFGQGFTLIEVLVALAVLTIALTSIYRLQSQTMMMSAKARFYSVAPLLARTKLSEIEHQGFESTVNESGDFGADYPGYAWSVRTEQVPVELTQPKPYRFVRIDLTIAQNEEESYALQTYRFYPE